MLKRYMAGHEGTHSSVLQQQGTARVGGGVDHAATAISPLPHVQHPLVEVVLAVPVKILYP